MHLVPFQLDLFPHSPEADNPSVPDPRHERSANQWHRAILAYLEFRSGDAWRRLDNLKQRFDPERLYYLDAIRLINGLRGFPDFLPAPTHHPEIHPKKLVTRSPRKKERVA